MRQGPVTAGSGQSIPAIALGRDEIGPAQFLEHQFGLSPRHMLAGYAAHYRERCLIGTDAVRIPLEQEDDHSPLQGCWTESFGTTSSSSRSLCLACHHEIDLVIIAGNAKQAPSSASNSHRRTCTLPAR